MNLGDKAALFKALGDPTRLRVFEFLCACTCSVAVEESGDVSRTDGPTVGEVCCHVLGTDKISSSLSFHLKELRSAGLISMERRGRRFICQVNQNAVADLAEYFMSRTSACCAPQEKE